MPCLAHDECRKCSEPLRAALVAAKELWASTMAERDAARAEYLALQAENAALRERLEQCEVQLAGCSVSALGWDKEPCSPGDYGWSASYGDVVKLRERLVTADAVAEAHNVLRDAFAEPLCKCPEHKAWREGRK